MAEKQQSNRKRGFGVPFPKGVSGNPNGRPKGKTMKEFARQFLMNMDDTAKEKWLAGLSADTVWKMAEGNPAQDTTATVNINPIPIVNVIQQHNIVSEDTETQ